MNPIGGLQSTSSLPNPTYIPAQSDVRITINLSLFNGCDTFPATTGEFDLYEGPDASFTPSKNDGFLNDMITFSINNISPNDTSFLWNFGPNYPTSTVVNPSQQFDRFGIFKVRLTVTNVNGCIDTDSLNIGIIRNQLIFVPNVFSPSAQKEDNRALKVFGTNISAQDFEFSVYNRWGIQVYTTNSLTEAQNIGWTGRLEGAADYEPVGVYTYFIKGKYFDGTPFEKIGNSTLIR